MEVGIHSCTCKGMWYACSMQAHWHVGMLAHGHVQMYSSISFGMHEVHCIEVGIHLITCKHMWVCMHVACKHVHAYLVKKSESVGMMEMKVE